MFGKRHAAEIPAVRAQCAEQEAGIWASVLFSWLNPLMQTGYRRRLQWNDIPIVHDARTSNLIQAKLQNAFRIHVQRRARYPMLRAIYEAFRYDFWLSAICQALTAILQVVAPFTLRYLLVYAQDSYNARQVGSKGPSIGVGLGLTFGITAMLMIQSLTVSHFHYRASLMGGQTRGALTSMIFLKSLRISRRAKAGGSGDAYRRDSQDDQIVWDPIGWSEGRIMNLIGTDANRILQALELVHFLWSAPLQILLTSALLIVNLGYSALPGIAFLFIGMAIVVHSTKMYTTARIKISKSTDARVGLTQEMLQAFRFIKVFAVENVFLSRLKPLRAAESRASEHLHLLRSFLESVSVSLPILTNLVIVVVYVVTGHTLIPATIFSSVALINALRTPLNYFPVAVGHCSDGLNALERVKTFLLAEESSDRFLPSREADLAIETEAAAFTWECNFEGDVSVQDEDKGSKNWRGRKKDVTIPETQASSVKELSPKTSNSDLKGVFKLSNVSLKLRKGELIGIAGRVGAGKSSMLSAFAGEMRLEHGTVRLDGSRAYCPQHAWAQNATVRDNILFGKPYDSAHYDRVVEACALLPDFRILPRGDLTEVGERGISLSGGQRQRISLARAVYADADVYILDDVLSAVDAHVGDHIFHRAIRGLLQSKCRIVAMHSPTFLRQCDRIVWMEDGEIRGVGTYEQLQLTTFSALSADEGVRQEESTVKPAVQEVVEPDNSAERGNEVEALYRADTAVVETVPWRIYIIWLQAAGSVVAVSMVVLSQILFRSANIMTNQWLSWWVADQWKFNIGGYAGIFTGLAVVQGVLLFISSVFPSVVGIRASRNLSDEAMWRIMSASVTFFEGTPLGRIVQRFSGDVDILDNTLTDAVRQFLTMISAILGSVILIIIYYYYFAIAAFVGTGAIIAAVSYYQKSAREIKRHHAVMEGASFARFSEGLIGAGTIRAYGVQAIFVQSLYKALDDSHSAYFLTFANQRWLAVRLDSIGNLLTFTVALLVAIDQFSVSPSVSGLVLSYSMSLGGLIQILIKYFAEVENGMSSTERLHEYATSVPFETTAGLTAAQLRPSWPERGQIEYSDVTMRYRPDLPVVIDKFSLQIRAGERIGIVGRTGAGKSTILSTIFRLYDLQSGNITIDGIDIASVSLKELRSRLAIVPQDPTLFQGTIRSNLDPENCHSDLELWQALRQAHLNPSDPTSQSEKSGRPVINIHLDDTVEAEAANLSLGQRQLLALARVLLRDSRIILVDEGTSSVDRQTDAMIQHTLAHDLQGKTLIAIAHRLRTIINFDRVCVMSKGQIIELGPPKLLWQQGNLFRDMCNANGITEKDFL